ncbi:hypothetical protein [Salibacter halophilus]|uniref:Uncharacterized protein n=1 Tax=Salibacter halophilus TaxID=1803916 RepID=A0A6N6MBL7_9FLAO|nr:hypothetical protein [Salibacter halophilus]KAB1064734.1 hypothetical protein F3059_05100 [Salibacter halophilus]
MVDVEEELKILENSVRDIITFVLKKSLGDNWVSNLKISESRIGKWKERQVIEEKRLRSTFLDNRLIYYSDFYDLKGIIIKHWDDGLDSVFRDKKLITALLSLIEKYRDAHAHRRELFDYQKYLIKGISGEIRTTIMQYRGKKEDSEDFFPRIEAANDSLGNSISNPTYSQIIVNDGTVRVGEEIELKAYSTDPLGDKIEFSIERIGEENWSESNKRKLTFKHDDIGKTCDIQIKIKSKKDYHAYGDFDDFIQFRYVVIPS